LPNMLRIALTTSVSISGRGVWNQIS